MASRHGEDNSLLIHQDVSIYLSVLEEGKILDYVLEPKRHASLQVIQGSISVNDRILETSDGLAISEESELRISATRSSEFMLFDLG